MDYVYFFYGFSFLLLAAVCRLLVRSGDASLNWGLLGLFGLLHGLNEWVDMAAMALPARPALTALRLALLGVSFAVLAEAGRRSMRAPVPAPAFYAPLAALAAAGWIWGPAGLNGSLRLAFGLTGGLLTAAAAWRRIVAAPAGAALPLKIMAAGLAVYALGAGAVLPGSGFLTARWLNYDLFTAVAGFPVQLLRGLAATAIAVGAWFYLLSARPAAAGVAARKARVGHWAAAAVLLVLAAGALFTARMGSDAESDLDARLDGASVLLHARVGDAMERADRAVAAMATSPNVVGGVTGRSGAAAAAAEASLRRHCAGAGLDVCYLMDMTGRTLASSNNGEKDSFLGKSYAFRPYFRTAAGGDHGSYFALGVTSGKRGYYASAPVVEAGRIVGVAAAKLELDFAISTMKEPEYVFLVSPEGVIFMSNVPGLLMRNLWPASAAQRAALSASDQFGKLSFEPLFPARPAGETEVAFSGGSFLFNAMPLGQAGWSVVTLGSFRPVLLARFAGIGVTMFLLLLTLSFFVILIYSEMAREEAEQIANLKEEVHALEGIVPICASCKQIRDDDGYWGRVEAYFSKRAGVSFTHSICPDCARKLYPDYCDEDEKKGAL